MKNFDTRTYSVNDFYQWHLRSELDLQPKFQRRAVWSVKAMSFLMDTIIRGKPMPKIFVREIVNPETRRTVRDVVDGQQRLRAILGFVQDAFPISKTHHKEFGGKLFSELPSDVQRDILRYELGVDSLFDASDQEVLDIFARLNSYSVVLKSQELLHATWFGEFKQTVYELALEFVTFWQTNRILTDAQILRMTDAELTSDLLIAMSVGIRAKKAITNYYKDFDDEFPNRYEIMDRFRHTMDVIGQIMDETLATSNFRRIHMFYTLFCSIYHFLYGLPEFDVDRVQFRTGDFPKIRIALERIDQIFEMTDEQRSVSERRFMEAARRATTDAPVRRQRSKYVCGEIVSTLTY